jgi:hypothetical protein
MIMVTRCAGLSGTGLLDTGTHEALVKPLDKSGYGEYLRRVLTDRLLP